MMNKITIFDSCSDYANHHQDVFNQSEVKPKKLAHILFPVKMPLKTYTARKIFVALSWVFLKGKVLLNVMNIKTEHI